MACGCCEFEKALAWTHSFSVAEVSDDGGLPRVAGNRIWRQIFKFRVDNFGQDVRAAADDVIVDDDVVAACTDIDAAASELENDQDLVAAKILCNEFELDRRRLFRTNGLRTTETRRVDRSVAVAAHLRRHEADLVAAGIFDPDLEPDSPARSQGSQVNGVLNLDPVLGSKKLLKET